MMHWIASPRTRIGDMTISASMNCPTVGVSVADIVSRPCRTLAGIITLRIGPRTATKNVAPTHAPNARGFSRVIRKPSSAASEAENPDILVLQAPSHVRRNESAPPLDARLRLAPVARKAPLA